MRRVENLAPLAGVLAGVLWLVGILVVQSGSPADPDTGNELVAYFRDERTTILLGGLLVGLSVFFFFWFLAALVSRAEATWLSRAALIGGTAGGTMMLALTGPHTTGATTDVELLGPEMSVALWRLSHTFFVGAEVALAVFVAAVALLGLERRDIPRWLTWSGLVIALLLLIIPIGWAALIFLVPLWLIALSAVQFRQRRNAVEQAVRS